jgi:hypothetical protein
MMYASFACLALLPFVIQSVHSYTESVAASVDGITASSHSAFVPMVAFKCGYRNQYTSNDGKWRSDADHAATCITGKFDILKYCRKVYPHLDVTNVVEYHHRVVVDDWCKEEGTPCKWQHTVQPYTCIVGEFKNEALQVPDGCRFGHLDERQSCEEFNYWQGTAEDECGRHMGSDSRTMRVRSFAVLQPCSIGKFSSVEFVCCPQMQADDLIVANLSVVSSPQHKTAPALLSPLKSDAIKESIFDRKTVKNSKSAEDDDEDDEEYFDDDEDSDVSDEEEEADDIIMSEIANEESSSSTPASVIAEGDDDVYFRLAQPEKEHEMYKQAVSRLEARHHVRVVKVMQEWAASENTYEKMQKTDPRQAETYKKTTKEDFHKTVAALDAEIKDQRKQIDEVHQERVQARLNEHKREAIRHYRDVLAEAVTDPHPHAVLEALEAYIRAEEKDRVHSLNRYNHLLQSDAPLAKTERPGLLRRLHDIDLRINGTIAMLTDFPKMITKVKPVIIQFWTEYRLENTPHTTDSLATSIGAQGKDERVLSLYERRINAESAITEGDDEVLQPEIELEEADSQAKHISPQLMAELDMIPGVMPVMAVQENIDEDNWHQAHAQSDMLVGEHNSFTESRAVATTWSHTMMLLGCVSLVVLLVGAIGYRRRQRGPHGFIEVDLYTPEEKQLAGMQHAGYENPTYHHFVDKV